MSSTVSVTIACDGVGCRSKWQGDAGEAAGVIRRLLADRHGWEHGRLQVGMQWRAVDFCRACSIRPPAAFKPTNPRRSKAEHSAGVVLE